MTVLMFSLFLMTKKLPLLSRTFVVIQLAPTTRAIQDKGKTAAESCQLGLFSLWIHYGNKNPPCWSVQSIWSWKKQTEARPL